jgi:DNA polymerase-3 subunit delta'
MNIEAYLKTQQKPIFDLFANALKKDKWSHAYLISGFQGQPLQPIALFLAQSILCENPQPLACGQCLTCQRFQKQDYTDLIIIDGSEASIKKQEVLNLASRFAITGLEKANKQVYLLHRVEAMTPEAINALLKFLEEPTLDIYALLTTTNLDEVLPTIQSRSQVIHLKPNQPQTLIKDAVDLGVDVSLAELLSFECGSSEEIKQKSTDELIIQTIKLLEKIVQLWLQNPLAAIHEFRMNAIPLLTETEHVEVYIQRWMVLLTELSKVIAKQEVVLKSYVKLLLGLSKVLPNPYQALNHLQNRLSRLDKSTNLTLFLEGMMIELLGV